MKAVYEFKPGTGIRVIRKGVGQITLIILHLSRKFEAHLKYFVEPLDEQNLDLPMDFQF